LIWWIKPRDDPHQESMDSDSQNILKYLRWTSEQT
jgi:hypothetical protein